MDIYLLKHDNIDLTIFEVIGNSVNRIKINDKCRRYLPIWASEVFATKIHRKQCTFSFTPYSLINISSDNTMTIGCKCPNFTTINTEFIPTIEIINGYKKPNDISFYEFYIQICSKNGINIRER